MNSLVRNMYRRANENGEHCFVKIQTLGNTPQMDFLRFASAHGKTRFKGR